MGKAQFVRKIARSQAFDFFFGDQVVTEFTKLNSHAIYFSLLLFGSLWSKCNSRAFCLKPGEVCI